MDYLFVGLGGLLGALSRYSFSKWAACRWKGKFPLATFLINISGSFGLGFLYVQFLQAGSHPEFLKSLTTTGFLGAFTTYSTFSFEIVNLVREGEGPVAVSYFILSLVLGLIMCFAGIWLGQLYSI